MKPQLRTNSVQLVKGSNARLYYDCLVTLIRPDTMSMVHEGVKHVWVADTVKNEFIEVHWLMCSTCAHAHRVADNMNGWFCRTCGADWGARYRKLYNQGIP